MTGRARDLGSADAAPGGWHADPAALHAWADGDADAVIAASVEQHLVRCADCRAVVAAAAAVPELDAVWSGIRDALELPPVTRTERLLTRLGLSPSDALLVAAAPVVRGAWAVALALVGLFALLAAIFGHGTATATFLLAAPVVPVLAVGLSYGPEVDPAFGQQAATPYSPLRLILLRSTAVLAIAIPLLGVAGLLLPRPVPVWWLLPAAAFTAGTLAASTWTTGPRAAGALAVVWVLLVARAEYAGTALAVLGRVPLTAYAALTVAALAVFTLRARPGSAHQHAGLR